MTKVLIIIPAYNEEASIGNLLKEIRSTGLPFHYTCLVVNDASDDETAREAVNAGGRVLNLPVNIGIGGAVQAGFLYALENDFDYVIQLDGDGQHPPAEIPKLYNRIRNSGSDLVIGSRFLAPGGFKSSLMRRKGISLLSFLLRLLSGTVIKDITSGFRIFNARAFSILAEEYSDEYPEPESIIILSLSGLNVSEVEVKMRDRQGGVSSISASGSVYYMLKVSLAMFFTFISLKSK